MEPTEPAAETPAEEPAPTPPDAVAEADVEAATDAAPGGPEEALGQLVEKAANGRLSPAEEEQAVRVLKEMLIAGKSGVATAAAALPKLVWMVGVSGDRSPAPA